MFDFDGPLALVVVAPHADDEVLGAGGLIARTARAGGRVHVVYMAVDELAHWGEASGATHPVRTAELAAVAARLGFSYEVFFDGEGVIERLDTVAQRELVDRFEDAYNRLRPDVLVLPHGGDFDQDHAATFRAACAAARPIPEALGKFFPRTVLTYEMPKVWDGQPFRPAVYVDVGATIDDKLEALRLYRTQLREPPHLRAPENVRSLAGLRGSEVGVEYAEAFGVHRALAGGPARP